MNDPDTCTEQPQAPRDPREPAADPSPRHQQISAADADFVDPYDMRLDPMPDEPGYGHGV